MKRKIVFLITILFFINALFIMNTSFATEIILTKDEYNNTKEITETGKIYKITKENKNISILTDQKIGIGCRIHQEIINIILSRM